MKDLLKMFFALSMFSLPNTLWAENIIDNTLKDHCKYILHGHLEGVNNDQADGYLLGFIQGIEYMTDTADLTDFFKSRNYRMVKERACKNSLENRTDKGFQADYKFEATKLVNKNMDL